MLVAWLGAGGGGGVKHEPCSSMEEINITNNALPLTTQDGRMHVNFQPLYPMSFLVYFQFSVNI